MKRYLNLLRGRETEATWENMVAMLKMRKIITWAACTEIIISTTGDLYHIYYGHPRLLITIFDLVVNVALVVFLVKLYRIPMIEMKVRDEDK